MFSRAAVCRWCTTVVPMSSATPPFLRGAASSAAAAAAAASSAKTTTNIVGLLVLENPREELTKAYTSILNAIKVMPEDAQYRKNVELMTRHRLGIVTEEEDVERIEERIGMGQVEELHEQAIRELNLIPRMAGTVTHVCIHLSLLLFVCFGENAFVAETAARPSTQHAVHTCAPTMTTESILRKAYILPPKKK